MNHDKSRYCVWRKSVVEFDSVYKPLEVELYKSNLMWPSNSNVNCKCLIIDKFISFVFSAKINSLLLTYGINEYMS